MSKKGQSLFIGMKRHGYINELKTLYIGCGYGENQEVFTEACQRDSYLIFNCLLAIITKFSKYSH
ncbi:MAG TPA: hypothetical protein EYP35_06795 [Desulfobacterales bacterium]|nr:hypothetical protein [Desulfobacterales bacterium]